MTFAADGRIRLLLLVGVLVAGGVAAPPAAKGQDPFSAADFVLISPGTFQMGSTNGQADEQPVHKVTLTRGFWMQKTLVTQAQWQAVMGSNPSKHIACPTCPVENVSYDQVQHFITELNYRSPEKKYRLPTEAEWEYAARAGTAGDYGTAGTVTSGGWIAANGGGLTHPVGALRPNAWGLYDMEGNVWEWVNDWYGPYLSGTITDPTGPASSDCGEGQTCRVLRGGSADSPASFARSASRFVSLPATQFDYFGFRLARTK
jgi:formylglycine-generating enzyme required for sulfatase activity